MSKIDILKTLDEYTKLICEADPENYSCNDYTYYTIVVKALLLYINKYNSYKYMLIEFGGVKRFIDYNRDDFRNEVYRDYSNLMEVYNRIHPYYISGIETSENKKTKSEYKSICESSNRRIVEHLMDLSVEAFELQMIEENLYFFLLVENHKTKPTEELYEEYRKHIFSNTISSFVRELKINQILAPKKRVRKPKK